MKLSRLRLRLTGGFALAFAGALGLLTALGLGYLWRESHRRLDDRLEAVARSAEENFRREFEEKGDSGATYAANEMVYEWPQSEDAFAILSESKSVIATADHDSVVDEAIAALPSVGGPSRYSFPANGQNYRVYATALKTFESKKNRVRYRVLSFRSTEGLSRDVELLLGALAIAAPLIVLLSLAGGYMLAGRALTPLDDLRNAIAEIAPTDLARRLPVRQPADEIGALASDFNAMLGRLDVAQRRNHRFVREAAHQIRTPLTLVLGEAENELAVAAPTSDRAHGALMRIRTAAEQMTHRVDELMLLAQAQAGEKVQLTETVELDGLVMECTDLMRGRATALSRTLAIGRAEHVAVRANSALLREAALELIENGCRHGTSDAPVSVSSYSAGGKAVLEVETAGDSYQLPDDSLNDSAPDGLGLPIVRWIAQVHGGELRVERRADRNAALVVLPAQA